MSGITKEGRARRLEARLHNNQLWEKMVERDAALGKLERRARGLRPYLKGKNVSRTFDRLFKLEINRLVGWGAKMSPTTHQTSECYDCCYDRILGILQGDPQYDETFKVTVTKREKEKA